MQKEYENILTHRFSFILVLFIGLAAILLVTFIIAYQTAKNEILDVGGEMVTKVLKDIIGFMYMMDERVKNDEMPLEQAQEIVRTYVNGPNKSGDNRDISKSRMAVDDYMYVWATSFKKK